MSDPLPVRRQFASDTWAPMCPEALAALVSASHGHAETYGDDAWTRRAAEQVREVFEKPDLEMFFVTTGTASNALALASLCQGYHSVICHRYAHIETDECGALGFASSGTTLLTVPGDGAKLTPAAVESSVFRRTDIHYPKPKVVSLTQSTEVGTVYTPAEVRALADMARQHGLHLHMDGARFANAVAHLGVSPADLTWRAGVEVLCLGGSKNGLAMGEIVVFFDPKLAEDFAYRVKQAGHLPAKLRYVAAPWVALLTDGLWLRRAEHANAQAQRLARGLMDMGLRLRHPVQANEVFVDLPEAPMAALQAKGWHCYNFIGDGGCRFVCAWDIIDQDVADLLADLRTCLG
jgi:threonine aldolase